MISKKRVALYPGTFDPITYGHWDIIRRSLNVVDKVIIAIANNESKKPLLTSNQRGDIILNDMKNMHSDIAGSLEVINFNGLTVDLARKHDAAVIIRGLRAVSDFEFEFQLAGMNSKLDPEIETLFLMAHDKHQFISSSLVKEIARLGGDVSKFVSPYVNEVLASIYKDKK